MAEKTINIAGQEVGLAYCFGTELNFKQATDKDITEYIVNTSLALSDNKMPDIEDSIECIIAANKAYEEAHDSKNYITKTTLRTALSPGELGAAIGTVSLLRAEFYHIPTGEPQDKPESDGSTAKEKNA